MWNVRLCMALGVVWLAAAAPAAADGDARQAVHDALAAQLPSVLTDTRLPDANEPDHGRVEQGGHKDKDRDRDHKDRDRDHKDSDRDHKDGDRDHKDSDRDHEGRDHDHGGRDHGEVERGDVGDHGEIGEHGSGAKPVEEEHGGGGGQQHGGGSSHHGGDQEDRH
jgi:hypothetical protein